MKRSHFLKPILPGSTDGIEIPAAFLEGLEVKRNHQRAVLRRDGKEWRVRISDNCFRHGWSKFAMENHLGSGDFAAFKYLGNMVFEVVVFDGKGDLSSKHDDDGDPGEPKERPLKKIKSEEKVEVAEHHQELGHHNFTLVIKPYTLNWGFMELPGEFARSNGLNNRTCSIIVKDPQQRLWYLNLKTSGYKIRMGRRSTLTELLTENGLKQGDTIKIELVENGVTPVLKILPCFTEVDPAGQETNEIPPSGHCPFFTSTIMPRSLSKTGVLNLPMEFVRSNGLIGKAEMILTDERHKSWQVRLRRHRYQFSITTGWKKFHEANGLKEGDAYKFEIIRKVNNRIKPVARFTLISKSTNNSTRKIQKENMATSLRPKFSKNTQNNLEEEGSTSQPMLEGDQVIATATLPAANSESSFDDLLRRIEASRSYSKMAISNVLSTNFPGGTMSLDLALQEAYNILSWGPTVIYGSHSNKVGSIVATLLNNSPNDEIKKALAAFQQHFAHHCTTYLACKPKVDNYLALVEKIETVVKKVEGRVGDLKKLTEDLDHVNLRNAELERESKELHAQQKELKERRFSTCKAAEESLNELVSLLSSQASSKEQFDLSLPIVNKAHIACNNLKDALRRLLQSA